VVEEIFHNEVEVSITSTTGNVITRLYSTPPKYILGNFFADADTSSPDEDTDTPPFHPAADWATIVSVFDIEQTGQARQGGLAVHFPDHTSYAILVGFDHQGDLQGPIIEILQLVGDDTVEPVVICAMEMYEESSECTVGIHRMGDSLCFFLDGDEFQLPQRIVYPEVFELPFFSLIAAGDGVSSFGHRSMSMWGFIRIKRENMLIVRRIVTQHSVFGMTRWTSRTSRTIC
jgi:hypothetical protein